jgi:hypothetical protein
VINNKKKAVLQAALQGCAYIVQYLLHLKVQDKEAEELNKEALQEAMREGLILAAQTILLQDSHVQVQGGQYNNVLQTGDK